jgi:hypothetical protein
MQNVQGTETPTPCLLCQAKVARSGYEREDCLELIEELAQRLKEVTEYEWRRYVLSE